MKGHNKIYHRYGVTLLILTVTAYCHSFSDVKTEPGEKEDQRCLTSVCEVKLSNNASFGNLYISAEHQTSYLSNLTTMCVLTVSHYLLKCALVFLSFVLVTSVLVVCEPNSLSKECKEVTCNQKSISARKSCLSLDFMSAALEILDAILVTSPEIKKQKSCFKDDSWMYELERNWMANVTEYFVYPAFHLLASYVPLSRSGSYNCKYSLTEIAEAGFMYTGEGEVISCTGCGQTVELSHITSDPRSSVYHRDICRFSEGNHSAVELQDVVDRSQPLTDLSFVATIAGPGGIETYGGPEHSAGELRAGGWPDSPGDDVVHRHVGDFCPDNPSENTTNPTTVWASSDLAGPSAVPKKDLPSVPSVGGPLTETQLGRDERQTAEAGPHRQPTADHENQGTRPEENPRGNSTHLDICSHGAFYDEYTNRVDTMTQKPNLKKKPCDKNQAHFLIKDLKIEFLPTGVRHAHFFRAVELMARLTVRIAVKKLSTKRPSSSEGEPAKYLIGTGSCLETAAVKLAPNEHDGFSKKWTSVKKYFPFNRKKFGKIYVETNSHVVFDDFEAKNTTIEFYFDRLNRKDVVKMKGVAVRHSDQPGVYKCQLICHTEDLELVDRLNRDREEFWNLVNNPPTDIHEALFRRVFVVGHPHGGEKILACGKSMMVKYMLTSQKQSNRTVLGMKEITHSERLPHDARNSVRKVLIFTTDTCIGMSGAPILSFKMTRDSGDGVNHQAVLVPELWMHNGVDIKYNLAGSVMQELECWSDDGTGEKENLPVASVTSLTNMSVRPQSVDLTDSTETSTAGATPPALPPETPSGLTQSERLGGSSCVAGPAVNDPAHVCQTRGTDSESGPRHPKYFEHVERLESFQNARNLDHIQSATQLADAGFFYKGELIRTTLTPTSSRLFGIL